MEQNGAWKKGHGLPPFSPTHITHKLLHHQQQQEQEEVEKEEEYRKKMKLNSTANWLGLADNTCYNHFSTKDITSVSLPTPSFGSTRRMDHPILQLHPYHHHQQQQQQQQLLPEMAIAESSLPWELGSNMRGEDNQSRINLTRDGRESLIDFVSTVDESGGGRTHKWYNNSPKDEWERRVGLGINHDMVDPTGFLNNNNIEESFMNHRGNSSNSNYNAAVMKGSGSSSGSNSKDRHSKVFTAKGVRDRRIRLALSTATQFYDIQDRLGYEQPSKAVDWLMSKARASIDQLPTVQPYSTLLSRRSTASLELPIATVQPNSDASHQYGRATHRIQDISGKPHAEEEEEEVKVVSGVEMSLADDTSPPRSLPYMRSIDIAATSSSSSLDSTGLQLREVWLKRCRSDKH